MKKILFLTLLFAATLTACKQEETTTVIVEEMAPEKSASPRGDVQI